MTRILLCLVCFTSFSACDSALADDHTVDVRLTTFAGQWRAEDASGFFDLDIAQGPFVQIGADLAADLTGAGTWTGGSFTISGSARPTGELQMLLAPPNSGPFVAYMSGSGTPTSFTVTANPYLGPPRTLTFTRRQTSVVFL